MIKVTLFFFLMILGQNLLSQDFNMIYTENGFWILQNSSYCIKDGRCLILRYDSSKFYPDSIRANYPFKVSPPILAVYDSKGNLISKIPSIYKSSDTITTYFEYIELNNILYGRALQTIKYNRDSFYRAWLVYQEFDKVSITPIANRIYKQYLGIVKIGQNTSMSNNDLRLEAAAKKVNKNIDYKYILLDRYDSLNFTKMDTSIYFLAMFDLGVRKFTKYEAKEKNFSNYPVLNGSHFFKDKIGNYNNGAYDTLGIIDSRSTQYNTLFNYQLQKLDTFVLKQNISNYIVRSIFGGFTNLYIDNSDTIHYFQYATIHEKVNGSYLSYFAFAHYKVIDTHLLFHKYLDDKKLLSAIPRGASTYRGIENIVPAPNNGFYVILYLNSMFPAPSGVRVYRLDASFNIIWKRDFMNAVPIFEMWWKNDGKLRAYENELGGFTMFFEAEDLDANVGIYCLKIDSTGKAIKLEGKDLTKTAIHNSGSNNYPMSVYPNPAQSYIQINTELPDKKKLGLEIFDLIGKKLALIYPDAQGRYDIKSINRGLYIVRLLDRNGDILHKQRLQIERE